jgi:hypothetical protein
MSPTGPNLPNPDAPNPDAHKSGAPRSNAPRPNPAGRRSEPKPEKRDYKVAIGVGAAVLAVAFVIFKLVGGSHGGHTRVVETMEIRVVPPPPPPPPKEPPPPPPPKIVEQPKIQQPIDKPVEPKPVDAPPPGPLALDAKGGPGSDAFGLGGRPGGADYLNGGGGTRGGHYAVMIISMVERRLHQDEKLDLGKFRGTVKIWFSTAGKVERVEIIHSTGDPDTDNRIKQAIATMPSLPEAFPGDLGPAIVRVGGKPSGEG